MKANMNTFWSALYAPQRDSQRPVDHLNPHYTNEYFKRAQTVYLAQGYTLKVGITEHVEGAGYDYSDRLRQWDYGKADAAWKAARERFNDDMRTAEAHEFYLRLYFDAPNLALVHILAGYNLSTGHPYQVYGYFKEGAPKS